MSSERIRLEEIDLEHLLRGGALHTKKGTQVILSDIGFDRMAELVEKVSNQNIRVSHSRPVN